MKEEGEPKVSEVARRAVRVELASRTSILVLCERRLLVLDLVVGDPNGTDGSWQLSLGIAHHLGLSVALADAVVERSRGEKGEE